MDPNLCCVARVPGEWWLVGYWGCVGCLQKLNLKYKFGFLVLIACNVFHEQKGKWSEDTLNRKSLAWMFVSPKLQEARANMTSWRWDCWDLRLKMSLWRHFAAFLPDPIHEVPATFCSENCSFLASLLPRKCHRKFSLKTVLMIAEQMIDCFWDLSIFTLQSRSPSSPSKAKRLSWLVVPILNAQLEWKRLKLARCVPWNGCFSVILTTNFCRWFGYCLNGLSLVYARIWSLSWHLNYRYVTVCKSFWVARFVCQQSTPPNLDGGHLRPLRFFERLQRSHGLSESGTSACFMTAVHLWQCLI